MLEITKLHMAKNHKSSGVFSLLMGVLVLLLIPFVLSGLVETGGTIQLFSRLLFFCSILGIIFGAVSCMGKEKDRFGKVGAALGIFGIFVMAFVLFSTPSP
jgi:peptidoglycan/LPS O-acetylase OafA/YrhL